MLMIGRLMGHPVTRLCMVAALILLVYAGARHMQAALDPPGVDWPDWTFNDLPTQLGDTVVWRGQDAPGDPEVTKASGADVTVSRSYRSESGRQVSLYSAMFKDPSKGVYHSPMYCYPANGWELLGKESKEDLRVFDDLTIPVSLSVWDRKNEKLVVLFWYQLGEHVLFDRMDLGFRVRAALMGRSRWPTLLKIMITVQVSDQKDAEATALDFAELVARWLNQPERRNGKGMLGTQDGSSP
jgi:EpsI family protein